MILNGVQKILVLWKEKVLPNLGSLSFLIIPFFALVLVADQAKSFSEKEVQNYFSETWKLEIDPKSNLELFKEAQRWIGTPHKDNSKNESGIDCSSLAAKLVQKAYSKTITGSSESISKQVKKIPESDLQEGDLVFFNIYGEKISHVGVYLKDRKFVHASVVKGVTVNSLDENYYKTRFVFAGRL
ncbi:C40 family peptidase [Leptospira sp. WS58.C1]|uniref:C40 family peptidase n=1 Tax=Leptospira TaxID=171 RepID=UPI0002BDA48A|nr:MULTISPECIES: C40 family peptidase [unclassified Leptospira]EMJ98895.1 NlpC/P60 family protein [Leptospira sp. B5-022]MCR1794615.1 C40 family peptidase [Leptospira sp. id769339]